MRKTSGILCPILAILVAFAAPLHSAFAAGCEDRLLSQLLQKTYFFDYESLATKSESQLRAMLLALESLKQVSAGRLQIMREKVSAAMAAETMTMKLSADISHLEEEQRGIDRYRQAVQRALERIGKPEVQVPFPILDVYVVDKSPNQVIAEIMTKLEKLPGGKSRQILRYFPAAREDLIRLHGTDLYGRELGDGSAWDEFGLEALLASRELNAEDGFYAVDSENAVYMGRLPDGEVIPFSMVNDFIRGTRALVIYDADQLLDFGVDYYLFHDPAQKRKAVHAIIRPRQ